MSSSDTMDSNEEEEDDDLRPRLDGKWSIIVQLHKVEKKTEIMMKRVYRREQTINNIYLKDHIATLTATFSRPVKFLK